jgi:hypothetical protein
MWRWLHVERPRWFLAGAVVVTTELAVVVPVVSAQNTRQLDVSVGYLTAGYLGYGYALHGWTVELTARKTPSWMLVGDVDWFSEDGARHRGLAGLGGGRFVWRPAARISPFWQILAGVLRESGPGRQQTRYSFAVQPSLGMTAMITPRFGMRVQAGLQFDLSTEVGGQSRVVAAGVIRFPDVP